MSETKPTPKMSKEDIAFYIRSIWESLLKPDWERSDLIDLGMAIFAKTPLSRLDPKKFSKLLPFLSAMAEELGKKTREHMMTEFETYVKKAMADQKSTLVTSTSSAPEAPLVVPPESAVSTPLVPSGDQTESTKENV